MLSYILNGILYYRRTNLVVMAAVAISTAVIGGSLIVGDSVRYSLRQMTEQRLGNITDVLHSPRFVRQALVDEMMGDNGGLSAQFAPALLVSGSIEAAAEGDGIRRAGSVTLLGIGDSGWQLLENGGITAPRDRDVILGYRTAQELNAQLGDDVSVWVEVPSSIPRDSLLGERDEVNVELVLTVSAIVPEDVGASRFDLNPGQQLPYNAFLSLTTLQERLGLEEIEFSPRDPIARPAKINAVLCGSVSETSGVPQPVADTQLLAFNAQLNDLLQQKLTVEDLGLRLRAISDRGYVSAESERMILEDAVASGVSAAADRLGLITAPTVVYLSNEIYAAKRGNPDERYSMYSIVAGLPFDSEPPLGPMQLRNGTSVPTLSDHDILLSSWLAEDLQVVEGDLVDATWHEVGSHGELPEVERQFTVKGILVADDATAVDPNLTPQVAGITDVESFSDVDQPFEMDMERLTQRDDDYWAAHRAAPKAFVSLQTAEELWQSRYGRFTSIRIATSAGSDKPSEDQLNSMAERLAFEIPRQLQPVQLGLAFRPVRAEGLQAAVGANDFTQLFIGFSFFLILSAIILASLMFRLGIQRRINQLGVLNAVGWPEKRIQRMFIGEGLLVSAAGSVVGAFIAVVFGMIMVYGLTTWWVGAVGTQFLQLDVQPGRLLLAIVISLSLAAIVIWSALRSFRHVSIRDQLAGNAESSETSHVSETEPFDAMASELSAEVEKSDRESGAQTKRKRRVSRWIGVGSFVTAIALPAAVNAGLVPTGEAFGGLSWQMVCFFLAGFSSLTAGLYLLAWLLRRRSRSLTVHGATRTLTGLGLANAARNPMRSMLTTALIAFATFVIVAVAAGRRNPLSETPDLKSGNGGFSLVAESARPVLFDLNSAEGRQRLGLKDDTAVPPGVKIYPFSMKPGSDASCVNLYQTRVPTMLGVSEDFIARGGFRFADTSGENPWQLLDAPVESSADNQLPVIPVMGDMNTLMYSLKKGIGSRILVPDEDNPEFALQVVGMLDGSVFQGVLLMSDANLKRVDPDVAGAQYFLIELPTTDTSRSETGATENQTPAPGPQISAADPDSAAGADEVSNRSLMDRTSSILESGLNDYGLDAEPVSERLASFLAVQNTYLSTFQMLGGLGLLVGTFGLAAVMMRNVVERRREIALMRAVGFTTFRIGRLILTENCVLLIWGILLGTGSAFLAMLPHLKSTGADLPWQQLVYTLVAVAIIGSLSATFAVRAATGLSIRDNLAAE